MYWRPFAISILASALALAQAPDKPAAALQNNGQPLSLSYSCTTADVEELDLSCSADQPCPVYLELSGVAGFLTKIFVTGNLHTESRTVSSVLLASSDDGRTWAEPARRIRGAGLDQIQFVDFSNGWVSGALLTQLPHDPFLLLTTDGGATWRQEPVLSEPGRGSIDQFAFSSRRDGSLLLDRGHAAEDGNRHELYETHTGGESWSLARVSRRPLTLPNSPPVPTGWRLRPDGATKTYAVEKLDGDAWRTVVRFAINAGKCAPQ